ncbi:MAG: nSTAND1 domain-containing NTPase [Gammaproteobacteria bacterium]
MLIHEQGVALDEQNPWPGLAPYDENGRNYFRGRDEDTEELLRLVRLAPLAVLYGKSGLGKSSLLRAGLFPRLRQEHYLPVYVRLDCSMEQHKPPMAQVFELLLAELAAQQADHPEPHAGESVWRYLHRRDLELWSRDNYLLTPVLVFDQFEEVFAHGRRDPQSLRQVCHELADLIENRIPAAIASGEESRQATSQLDLLSQKYRIILSFREDYLPEIKNWECDVPALLKQWRQLKPMSREQAVEAVSGSGASVLARGAAEAIVDFVGNLDEARDEGVNTIEPVLLSLCCYQLNLRRQQRRMQWIDTELLSHVGQNILQEFYANAIARMPNSVRQFIETQLILGDRYRASYPVRLAIDKGFINEAQLADLTGKHRLLRIDQQLGSDRIELIHDRVVSVVRRARDQRNKTKEIRKIWVIAVLVMAVAASSMSGGFIFWQRSIDQMDLAKAQADLIDLKRAPVATQNAGARGVIYIQIRDGGQLPRSSQIREGLQGEGFKVPEIETLSTGPSKTEVRYFDDGIGSEAGKIVDYLRNAGVKDATAKFIPDYQHVKRRRQIFEIWFAPNAFNG